jgi:hypothetical protein
MGTPSVVEQGSPTVLASNMRDSPNVVMGERECIQAYLMGTPSLVEQGSPGLIFLNEI